MNTYFTVHAPLHGGVVEVPGHDLGVLGSGYGRSTLPGIYPGRAK